MSSNEGDRSRPEGERTANRRWMIGIVLSLVFGTFGAVMAVLSYMDRDRKTTIDRNGKAPSAAPASPSSAPAPAPANDEKHDKGKGNDKK